MVKFGEPPTNNQKLIDAFNNWDVWITSEWSIFIQDTLETDCYIITFSASDDTVMQHEVDRNGILLGISNDINYLEQEAYNRGIPGIEFYNLLEQNILYDNISGYPDGFKSVPQWSVDVSYWIKASPDFYPYENLFRVDNHPTEGV